LILEALRLQDRRWLEWFTRDVERRASEPRERLLAVFEVLEAWFDQADFQGCAFLRACQEYPDLGSPARQVARRHQESIRDYLRRLAEDASLPEPDTVVAQMCLLMAGAIVTAQAGGGSQAARHALAIAETLIEAAQPGEPTPAGETWID
ncbi:MAG: TetR/AcrR family transcriptional regulator, partial [Phycisphaerae bacterium]